MRILQTFDKTNKKRTIKLANRPLFKWEIEKT